MNADRLLAHYAKIADGPDAIARLRRFVLELAVRGKLVPQDASDEPASELLERIRHERARREKLKAIKRLKLQYGPIALDSDFALPSQWAKATLGETCDLQTGATPDRNRPEFFGGDIRWLVSGDVNRGEIFDCDGRITKAALESSNCKILPQDCVLIALNGQGKTRATVALLRTEAACNQSLVAIIPLLGSDLTAEYLHLSLKARYVAIREVTGKDERRGLNMRLLECFEVVIPPVAEQHRIVAKVDELMGLCDRLEAARSAREATRNRLAAASLARLNSPDPTTFQTDARFVLNALPALTARPDQIKQLRQTVLNLAMRGKLVPQDSNDEPASELLKRIGKEKARLVQAGVIPAKKEPERDPTKLTEELPALWCPTALGRVCNLVTSGSRGWAEFYATSGPGFIRAQNIRFGKLRLDDLAFVNPPSNSEGSRTQVAKGDLLIVITGAGVTNPALLDHDPGEAYVSQHVGLIRPSDPQLSAWLLLCLMADRGGRAELVERAYGAGKPGLNLENIRSLSIPLPPLAEQHRIVASVDALMALCDRLEANLTVTAATRHRLLDALLDEALAPTRARELEAAE
jgi:type I restriction enzyme S subunit